MDLLIIVFYVAGASVTAHLLGAFIGDPILLKYLHLLPSEDIKKARGHLNTKLWEALVEHHTLPVKAKRFIRISIFLISLSKRLWLVVLILLLARFAQFIYID